MLSDKERSTIRELIREDIVVQREINWWITDVGIYILINLYRGKLNDPNPISLIGI